jgi:plastocyanin
VLTVATITAFHIIGGCLALWAVLLTVAGMMNHDFPPKGLEKVIIGISVLLVAGAISSAIITSGEEKPKGSEVANHQNKAGEEGSQTPGGTQAPGTGSSNGQNSGGGKPPPAGAVKQTLQLKADPTRLAFDKSTLTAKAGAIRIVMQNPSQVPHNVSLQGPGGLDQHGPTVPNGGASQVSGNLKPGKYTFYCSVPGHRQAGMQGTLTVTK